MLTTADLVDLQERGRKYHVPPEEQPIYNDPDSPYQTAWVDGKKTLMFNAHRGQRAMLASTARIILLLAGTQSGKTVSTPKWLEREIYKRGMGDYIVATPTFPLMEKKALPAMMELFCEQMGVGSYNKSDHVFTFSESGSKRFFGEKYRPKAKTRIHFCHAQNPDALEAATAKAAVLDEAGQKKFKWGSYKAIRRRVARYKGRVLITTTPYSSTGWLKKEIYDRRNEEGLSIDVIQFKSLLNPGFPDSEYYLAMNSGMPDWEFRMMYDGRFEFPAGRIYDIFDPALHCIPRKEIPANWHRYLGVDFGDVNMAGVYLAREETPSGKVTGRYYLYKTYHAGKKTYEQHGKDMLSAPTTVQKQREFNGLTKNELDPEVVMPRTWGGSNTERQQRREFRTSAWPIKRPRAFHVDAQIRTTYSMINKGRLLIFDDLPDIIQDLQEYSREMNDEGEITEEIENKETYHKLDALRYVAQGLAEGVYENRVVKAVH